MLLPLNCAFVCGRRESCGLLLIFEELGVSGLDASKALGNLNSAAMQCMYADTSECRLESVCCSCPGPGPWAEMSERLDLPPVCLLGERRAIPVLLKTTTTKQLERPCYYVEFQFNLSEGDMPTPPH